MLKKLISVTACILFVSACAETEYLVGSTGQNTGFERTGVATCPTSRIVAVGTASDPVRCGPQTQPLR